MWVPGCSTGEEAFTYGMLVRELLDAQGRTTPVQIFATDLSTHAIATARGGTYSAAEVKHLSLDRLQRFFLKTERGYVVQKQLRDMCVFSLHNVIQDPPFSGLDLISCRNLMIYVRQKRQHSLMSNFHLALNPEGWLVLGNSESVGSYADRFRLVDHRFRVYVRKSGSHR